MGHAPWIEEALLNYINNGIKYGGSPPKLQLGTDIQPDNMVCIWVKDNGQGIAEIDQARLLNRTRGCSKDMFEEKDLVFPLSIALSIGVVERLA